MFEFATRLRDSTLPPFTALYRNPGVDEKKTPTREHKQRVAQIPTAQLTNGAEIWATLSAYTPAYYINELSIGRLAAQRSNLSMERNH